MPAVEARTVQTTPFRGCFEALKDILTETTLTFDKLSNFLHIQYGEKDSSGCYLSFNTIV